MGREIRKVPKDWEHPKNENGHNIPLYGGSFQKELAEWEEGNLKWQQGLRSDFNGGWQLKESAELHMSYEEWSRQKPDKEDYMPDWPEAERTHLQMYENTSEGTPISPVMETPEALAKWLTDNNASAFGGMTATYEQWLATCSKGYAVGMIYSPQTGLKSGVECS